MLGIAVSLLCHQSRSLYVGHAPFNAVEIAFWRLAIAAFLVYADGSPHTSALTLKTERSSTLPLLWSDHRVTLLLLYCSTPIYNDRTCTGFNLYITYFCYLAFSHCSA